MRRECRYCKRKRMEKNISVFDVFNGCVCDDCCDQYDEDYKNGNLNGPFDD